MFSHFALPEEPLTPARVFAAGLALAGAAVVELPSLSGLGQVVHPAALLPLGAAVASAMGNVWLKKRIAHVHGAVSLWGQTLVGGSFLMLLALALERRAPVHVTAVGVGALLYLTLFGTLLTFLALFWLVPRISMVAIGIIPIIDTCVAVFLGVSLFHEAFSARMAIGACMVLCAAALAALSGPSLRQPVPNA